MNQPQLIIPGFFPDPSICRVGEDLFTVHSTFEYLPGVPLFHSRDLAEWIQIGNVLDRPSQLPATSTGGGIFAPTIRHRDGRFWMTTTDIGRVLQGQLLVHTDDPFGRWSDPVFVPGTGGIDPDLAWDDDGTCYLTWTSFRRGESVILQAPVDLAAGRLLGDPLVLRRGTHQHTEGPHIFRRGDWWYLLTADGGTERGHMVWVSRGPSISGPFEPAPEPLLSRRSTNGELQNTGHGDIVELADGRWAMVHLGVRVRGATPSFHVNGRETFISGIGWEYGWPVLEDVHLGAVSSSTSVEERFAGPLGPEWISPGSWPRDFVTVDKGLYMAGALGAPRMLGIRARDLAWDVDVEVEEGCPTIAVRLDDDHVLRVRVEERSIRAELSLVGLKADIGDLPRALGPLSVRIECRTLGESAMERKGPDELRLTIVQEGIHGELGRIDGRYLSTEVAGGFTGRIIGIEQGAAPSRVAAFRYRPVDDAGMSPRRRTGD